MGPSDICFAETNRQICKKIHKIHKRTKNLYKLMIREKGGRKPAPVSWRLFVQVVLIFIHFGWCCRFSDYICFFRRRLGWPKLNGLVYCDISVRFRDVFNFWGLCFAVLVSLNSFISLTHKGK